MTKTPVTGGARNWPMVDRNGRQIYVGDRIRFQYCSGSYGRTRITETTVEKAHYPYCMIPAPGCIAEFHLSGGKLVGFYQHIDFEHAHEKWVEVI